MRITLPLKPFCQKSIVRPGRMPAAFLCSLCHPLCVETCWFTSVLSAPSRSVLRVSHSLLIRAFYCEGGQTSTLTQCWPVGQSRRRPANIKPALVQSIVPVLMPEHELLTRAELGLCRLVLAASSIHCQTRSPANATR